MQRATATSAIARLYWLVLVPGLLIGGGCATESAKKADLAVSSSGSDAGGKAPAGKSRVAARQSSGTSSLDSLRAGMPPADGPLKNIYFAFDSYALSADARATLTANAAWLKSNPSVAVEVEGHCDERGTTEYNLALGAKRARAAVDYLVSLGISAARLKTASYGEEVTVCKQGTEDCHAKNRRARFVELRGRPTS